jgi:surface polysaccharide O-acyltransferase-like enzyme
MEFRLSDHKLAGLADPAAELRPVVVHAPDPAVAPGHPVPHSSRGAKQKDQSIETLRGLAILTVVAGHVIGDTGSYGLRVEPGSIYRYLYDATTYLRMPMFFVISGFLYAHRPVVPGKLAEFVRGKARLLVLPFLSVATLQYVSKAIIGGTDNPFPIRDIWRIYVFGFDHFWFSQAMMSTFAAVLIAEKVLKLPGPYKWPVYLLLAILFDLVVPKTTLFSLNMFSVMLPFFLMGCLLYRLPARLQGPEAVSIAVLVFLASLTTQQLLWFGLLALTGQQTLVLQLVEGLSFNFLLFRFRWTSPRLAVLGGFSYPIYLFHVFGTAGSRMVATSLGIGERALLLAIGITCGLSLPIAIDLAFRRSRILRRVFLGSR